MVKGKAKRIDMPEKEKNNVKFINQRKQMLSPFVVYGDLETSVKKIAEMDNGKGKLHAQDRSTHEGCGYPYVIVRSDGLAFTRERLYGGENVVEHCFLQLFENEKIIKDRLATP